MAMGNRPNDTINGAAVVYMAHWYDDFANGNKRFVTDIDPCDDGDPCTSDECDLELGCLHFPKNCSDGDLCTTDTCDSSNGECHHNMPAGQECCHWDGLIFHHDDLYDPTLRCCGPNGVVPKLPISDLSDCPNRVDNPNASPTTNGCGPGWTPVPECPMCVPYGIIPTQDCTGCFLGACDYHDFCYATCNSNKPQCDYNFAANMHQICDQYYSWNPIWKTECHDKASLYDGAVSSWGDKSYDQGQKEACQCCE